jgi:hypothetical protein
MELRHGRGKPLDKDVFGQGLFCDNLVIRHKLGNMYRKCCPALKDQQKSDVY